jgi:hypothetical protein
MVMDLPNLFSAGSQPEEPQKIIGILLSRTKVQALLLSIGTQKLELLSQSQIVTYADDQNCLIQTDESLQQLGPESEQVTKVVFGLDHDWVQEGDIVPEHKELLGSLTKGLDLEPIGFIDTAEALYQHYLAQNSTLSTVFVIVGATALTISYVSQGKLVGIEQVGRSDSIDADLHEGLARFSAQVADQQFYLPSKLYLASFDLIDSEIEEIHQQLLDFDWTGSARFLQTPTMTVLSDDEYTAVMAHEAARAGAIATGNYTAAAIVPEAAVPDEVEAAQNQESFGFSNLGEEAAETADEETAVPQANLEAGPLEESNGIVAAGVDDNVTPVPAQTASTFGIPISTDKLIDSQKSVDEIEAELAVREQAQPKEKSPFLQRLKEAWNEPYKGRRSLKFFVILGFVGGLIMVALISMLALYTIARAEVRVTPEYKRISKDFEMTLDSRATASDPDKLILAAKAIEKQVSGESTLPTTGVSIVGDKATGKVTIFNKTTSRKTFNAGTVLTAGELKFTLDEEVTVASASVKEVSGGEEKSYGKADAAVTAADIGADYNLEKDKELTVASFSTDSYEAKVAGDGLSGGASREVRVVSETDQATQLKALKEELLAKANAEFKEESKDGRNILPASEVLSEEAVFSAETGKEANELNLKLTIRVSALSYTQEDLMPLAKVLLASEVPDGYELSAEPPKPMTNPLDASTSANTQLKLQVNLMAKAQPILSFDDLIRTIAGQPLDEAAGILISTGKIKAAEVNILPAPAAWIRKKLPADNRIEILINDDQT